MAEIIPPYPPLLKVGRGDYWINRNGVTLIELIVVVSVIGILVVALGFSFQGWMGKYRVESQIKEMYTDLMNAKAGAIQRNRMYFVTLTTTQYTIYEDTNTAPDGDEIIQTGADRLVLQKNLNPQDPITWNGGAQINFTKKGLSNVDKTICSNKDVGPGEDVDADYNCIIISALRVNTGKLTKEIPDGGTCDATNCVAK